MCRAVFSCCFSSPSKIFFSLDHLNAAQSTLIAVLSSPLKETRRISQLNSRMMTGTGNAFSCSSAGGGSWAGEAVVKNIYWSTARSLCPLLFLSCVPRSSACCVLWIVWIFLSSFHLSVNAREENEETLPQRHLLLLRALLLCLPTHLVRLPGLVAALVNVCVSPGARISLSPWVTVKCCSVA